jgi:glycosyltransferase involved in cell wall biosynthesis
MNITIAYNFKDGPFGGGNQFLKALRNEFIRRSWYTGNIEQADIILYNSYFSDTLEYYDLLYNLKRRKRPIYLHRLDGIFSEYRGSSFHRRYDMLTSHWSKIASDGVIFQNDFCRDAQMNFGFPKHIPHVCITNAPDPSLFYPSECIPAGDKIRIVYTSWSSNQRKGFPSLSFLDNTLDFKKYDFTFAGNVPEDFSLKNIKVMPPLASKELGQLLRKQHIFIGLSHGEPCSNAILEAMHSGIPVIIRNSGGNSEFVPYGAVLFDRDEDIPSLIDMVWNDHLKYKTSLCPLGIEDIADQYINFAKALCEDHAGRKINPVAYYNFRSLLLQYASVPQNGLSDKLLKILGRVRRKQ